MAGKATKCSDGKSTWEVSAGLEADSAKDLHVCDVAADARPSGPPHIRPCAEHGRKAVGLKMSHDSLVLSQRFEPDLCCL